MVSARRSRKPRRSSANSPGNKQVSNGEQITLRTKCSLFASCLKGAGNTTESRATSVVPSSRTSDMDPQCRSNADGSPSPLLSRRDLLRSYEGNRLWHDLVTASSSSSARDKDVLSLTSLAGFTPTFLTYVAQRLPPDILSEHWLNRPCGKWELNPSQWFNRVMQVASDLLLSTDQPTRGDVLYFLGNVLPLAPVDGTSSPTSLGC